MSNASEDFYGVGSGEVFYTLPSESQQKAARVISEILDIDLPEIFSADAYWVYINQHMDESRKKSRSRRSFHSLQQNYLSTQDLEIHSQREADWEALHLDTNVYAQRILDGKSLPSSWSNIHTLAEMQNRLRALGYKSSSEQELEKAQEEIEYLERR